MNPSAPICIRKSMSCTFFVVSRVIGFVLIGIVNDWSSAKSLAARNAAFCFTESVSLDTVFTSVVYVSSVKFE